MNIFNDPIPKESLVQKRNRRYRKWYRTFKDMLTTLQDDGFDRDEIFYILDMVYTTMNDNYGFAYANVAWSAKMSLILLLEDCYPDVIDKYRVAETL